MSVTARNDTDLRSRLHEAISLNEVVELVISSLESDGHLTSASLDRLSEIIRRFSVFLLGAFDVRLVSEVEPHHVYAFIEASTERGSCPSVAARQGGAGGWGCVLPVPLRTTSATSGSLLAVDAAGALATEAAAGGLAAGSASGDGRLHEQKAAASAARAIVSGRESVSVIAGLSNNRCRRPPSRPDGSGLSPHGSMRVPTGRASPSLSACFRVGPPVFRRSGAAPARRG